MTLGKRIKPTFSALQMGRPLHKERLESIYFLRNGWVGHDIEKFWGTCVVVITRNLYNEGWAIT